MSKLKSHSTDNRICITVDTDIERNKFMHVYKPEHVTINIDKDSGHVVVIVNDSCVFNVTSANKLIVIK